MNPNGNIENLKPFKKGESGNPKGYPKGVPNRATLLKKLIKDSGKFKHPITKAETIETCEVQINLVLIQKALSGNLQAIKEIFDTLYGKVPDRQKIEYPSGVTINLKHGK